jgi:hypothetical protein
MYRTFTRSGWRWTSATVSCRRKRTSGWLSRVKRVAVLATSGDSGWGGWKATVVERRWGMYVRMREGARKRMKYIGKLPSA